MSGKRRPGGRGSSGSTRRTAAPRRSRQEAATTPYGEPSDVDLHPRDRGPVRTFVRDVVDARRGPVGLLLPAAGITVTCAFAPASDLQRYLLLGSLVEQIMHANPKMHRALLGGATAAAATALGT